MHELTWEARMAARTAERARVAAALATSIEDTRWARWRGLIEREEVARRAHMTLGEATELRAAAPWACACVGPPHCCRYAIDQAAALNRAAHIVARLLTDAARVEAGSTGNPC